MRRTRAVVLSVVMLAMAAMLTACNTPTSNTVTSFGNMSVTLKGNPSDAAPSVTVTGTNGVNYFTVVTSSTMLRDLVPGAYQVTPQLLTLRRNVFDTVTSNPTVTVDAGKTASDTVTYTPQPGDVWVSRGNNGGPDKYLASSLYSGSPQTGTGITGLNHPYGMAFDANGNLWVVNFGTTTVLEYSASSLASGTPAVATSFSAGSNTGPEGLAFDNNGNLWLTNYGEGSVVEYKASTLGSATPTKLLTISIPTPDGWSPSNLAFDASGDLWVAEPINGLGFAISDQLVEYTASSIANGSPSIGITLTFTNNANDIGLAFDASGNLWVGLDTSVVEYTAASLASGSPATGITINTGNPSLPIGVAFDVFGNLWVAEAGANTVVDYTASSIASGNPVQDATISVTTPIDLAFGPPPYNLPLSH